LDFVREAFELHVCVGGFERFNRVPDNLLTRDLQSNTFEECNLTLYIFMIVCFFHSVRLKLEAGNKHITDAFVVVVIKHSLASKRVNGFVDRINVT